MPRYRFIGHVETVLSGLSHLVNATLHGEHEQPDGSTVVAKPGDEVTTDAPYPHALMLNVDTGATDLEPVAPPADAAAAPVPRKPRKAAAKKAAAKAAAPTPPAVAAEAAAPAPALAAAPVPTEGQE